MPAQRKQRRRRTHPRRDRAQAVSLATVDGLEGLSIGNLAGALDMSKSGVYAHFGSKQELQLATVDEAGRIFHAEVIEPALAAAPGWRSSSRCATPSSTTSCGARSPAAASSPGPSWRWAPRRAGQGTDRRVSRRVHGADPPVRRHRTRTRRASRRRGPRRAHLRAQRHHPRRQHHGSRIPLRGPWSRPRRRRPCPSHPPWHCPRRTAPESAHR